MALPQHVLDRVLVFGGIAIVLFTLTIVAPAMGVFDTEELQAARFGELQRGTVLRVASDRITSSERGEVRTQVLILDLGGETARIEHSRAELDAGIGALAEGDQVLLGWTALPDGTRSYYVVDRVRTRPLLALGLLFAVLVLLAARGRGLLSLLGMATSLWVILRFIIPAILAGHPPVAVAFVGAMVIMVTTLFLSHGLSRKTAVALAGTTVSLCVTLLLAEVSIGLTRLTGTASEDSATLQGMFQGQINTEGLLLAGIIIGALGVLDDVTVAQASAVFELRRANERLGPWELYRRGMNVGRDHIASTVNTLVLAYAGAALPLMILLAVSAEPLLTLLNREFVTAEIVRTLAGSMGLVAAVPATTALAAAVAGRSSRIGAGSAPPGTAG